jgi:hypothetical protein
VNEENGTGQVFTTYRFSFTTVNPIPISLGRLEIDVPTAITVPLASGVPVLTLVCETNSSNEKWCDNSSPVLAMSGQLVSIENIFTGYVPSGKVIQFTL